MQFAPLPVLEPMTYASPSRTFTLSVDPSDREGRGPASYRVLKNNTLVWEGTRPFTLWQAGITDTGLVGGYAYSNGPHGFATKPTRDRGTFEVVLLDATGALRVHETISRTSSHYVDVGSPNPCATGLFLDPETDRFVVRVRDENLNRNAENWWIYSLTTSLPGQRITPREAMPPRSPARFIIDAQPVAGTGLTLLHWWRVGAGEPTLLGATFTLIDRVGTPVWQLELPHDYNINADERTVWKFRQEIRSRGALLACHTSRQFTLRFVAARQAVTYTLVPQGSTWLVRQSGTAPYMPSAPLAFVASTTHLKSKGSIVLTGPRRAPLPEISALQMLEDGTILAADSHTGTVHVLDPEGTWRARCAPQAPPSGPLEIERGPDRTFFVEDQRFTVRGKRAPRIPGYRTVRERRKQLTRRPDNTWISRHGRQAAIAPSGALAVVDEKLSLYSPTDAPERVIPLLEQLAFSFVAYDGKRVLLADARTAFAYRATGEPLWKFPLPERLTGEITWQPFLIEGGKTLCLFDGSRTVYRYAME